MIRDFAKPQQCGTFLCLYAVNSIQAYLETFCKLNRPLLPVLVEIRIYPAITEIFVSQMVLYLPDTTSGRLTHL